MRKLMGLFFLSLAFSACHPSLFSDTPRYMRMQDRFARYAGGGRASSEEDGNVSGGEAGRKAVLMATALVFPADAPWRDNDVRDDAQILLLKDGEEVLRVPAGPRAHPDRHRYLRGHLWSDSSDGAQTIIYCDGKEYCRFSGEELLVGFLPVGEKLHTLGQRQGGGGFCYRIDGEEVFSADQGTVLGNAQEHACEGGALMQDTGGIYYVYCIPVRTQQKLDWEYRVMQGPSTVKSILAGTSESIIDIRVHKGDIYRLEQRGSIKSLAVTRDNATVTLVDQFLDQTSGCALISGNDGSLWVKGAGRDGPVGAYTAWFQSMDGTLKSLSSPYPFSEWQQSDEGMAGIDIRNGQVGVLWRSGEQAQALPQGYLLTSTLCMHASKENLALGLTAAEGCEHLLLMNEKTIPLSFNGYFTSVYIE